MGNSLLNGLSELECYSFDPLQHPNQVIYNSLFAHPRHLLLQSPEGWTVFGLKKNGAPVAQLAFHTKSNEAASPFRAPFGSFQLMPNVTQKEFFFFVASVVAFLTKQGVRNIIIKHYPEEYAAIVTKRASKALTSVGFKERVHVSSIIYVYKSDFVEQIKISKKQKLKKSKERFSFQQVQISNFVRIYRFISACRKSKTQTLSMSENELGRVVKEFPDDFFLFEVTDNKSVAAAAIVIRVNERTLYTFYYGHDKQYDKYSPVVFLLSGIYSFAQKSRYKMIDLGTSMNGDKINKSLLHFKESVGGKSSRKLIFEKRLQ